VPPTAPLPRRRRAICRPPHAIELVEIGEQAIEDRQQGVARLVDAAADRDFYICNHPVETTGIVRPASNDGACIRLDNQRLLLAHCGGGRF
jgi:hypothetical protein